MGKSYTNRWDLERLGTGRTNRPHARFASMLGFAKQCHQAIWPFNNMPLPYIKVPTANLPIMMLSLPACCQASGKV